MELNFFHEKCASFIFCIRNNTLKIKYNYKYRAAFFLCYTYPLLRPYIYFSRVYSLSLSNESDYYYANKMLHEIKGMTNNRNRDL